MDVLAVDPVAGSLLHTIHPAIPDSLVLWLVTANIS